MESVGQRLRFVQTITMGSAIHQPETVDIRINNQMCEQCKTDVMTVFFFYFIPDIIKYETH